MKNKLCLALTLFLIMFGGFYILYLKSLPEPYKMKKTYITQIFIDKNRMLTFGTSSEIDKFYNLNYRLSRYTYDVEKCYVGEMGFGYNRTVLYYLIEKGDKNDEIK